MAWYIRTSLLDEDRPSARLSPETLAAYLTARDTMTAEIQKLPKDDPLWGVHPVDMMTGFRGRQQATVQLKPGEPLVLQKTTLFLVLGGKKPAAHDYTQRMTAQPGVYEIQLTDSVRHVGLNIICTTPKLRFTVPR